MKRTTRNKPLVKPEARAHDPVRDWRSTNPDYQYSPPTRVVIDGRRCVSIDGGSFADAAAAAKLGGKRK